jgi:tRNA G18 (ribose-2'-O)-methylase SpoU
MAQVAQRGGFNPDLLKKRLGPHDRLDLPSAHPPYGLRPHDTLPQVQRVSAALALCHTRFNVNVGVAMRSAEAAGLEALYLMGESSLSMSPTRGAELAIPLHHAPDPLALLMMARKAGYQIVAVQQTPDSQPYHQATYPPCPLFVLGSEDSGLPDLLREAADLVVEIPLHGLIDSLNVATAATCVIMHWRNHYLG